jgi:hypothetical protein
MIEHEYLWIIPGDGRELDEVVEIPGMPVGTSRVVIDSPVRLHGAGETDRQRSGRFSLPIEATVAVGAPGARARTKKWLGTGISVPYADGLYEIDRVLAARVEQPFTRDLERFATPWELRLEATAELRPRSPLERPSSSVLLVPITVRYE